MNNDNSGSKGRPSVALLPLVGKDEDPPGLVKKNNGEDEEWKNDDGTGPVSRKRFDKLRRRLAAANTAIEARYGDLAEAVQENAVLAAKVETADKITADHKDITRRMQALHQAQRTELEAEISDRAAIERGLRKDLRDLQMKLREASGGDQR